SAADLQDALAQYLFSQRLKVTSRDIERLVAECLDEKRRSQPREQKPLGNLIDELINEEILKFTSLDEMSAAAPSSVSPSPTDSAGNAPLDPGSFIDTRGWADDVGDAKAAARNGQQRKAQADMGLEDLLEGDGALSMGKQAPASAARKAASGSQPS